MESHVILPQLFTQNLHNSTFQKIIKLKIIRIIKI